MSVGKKETITGTVIVKTICRGSKSEHEATMIKTDQSGTDFVIRVKNGNPFHDEALDSFVGKRVSLEGAFLDGPRSDTFFVDSVSDITVLGPDGLIRDPRPPVTKPPQP